MQRWLGVVLVGVIGLLGACTKSNPAKHCDTGTCIDPAFPFCDVTGSVGGEAGTCIAVTCTAGAFAECRADAEVRCNAAGNNYDVVQCPLGCDAAADGCRLCNPGETACTNGKVATCDANGTVTTSESCALGCFESEPRCREIVPSNGLATYFDMVASPPDLTLNDADFDADTGIATEMPSGTMVTPPSFLMSAPSGGVPVRVVVADNVTIQRVTVRGVAALAVLARRDIKVTGQINVGAGSSSYQGCSGGEGHYSASCINATSAGGGGANATNGTSGGSSSSGAGGGPGLASGTAALVPLVGGCSGGGTDGIAVGGGGAGAIQLVSRTRISIDGIINARGGNGTTYSDSSNNPNEIDVGGGGAGGGILLEAPTVSLAATAQLLAHGGDGGAQCTSATSYCALGGRGAHTGTAATAGGNIGCDSNPWHTSGGGGGGLGRIRINTRDNTMLQKPDTAVLDGDVSGAAIGTR